MFGIHFGLEGVVPIVFYIFGAVLIMMALFIDCRPPFLFLIFLMPMQNLLEKLHGLPLGKDLIDLLLIAIIIGSMMKNFNNKELITARNPLITIVISTILYTFISFLIGCLNSSSVYIISRIETWKNYTILPIIFFIAVKIIDDKKWFNLTIITICFALIYTGFDFYRDFKYTAVTSFSYGIRRSGTFVYLGPNEFAAFHAHYLIFFLGFLFYERNKTKKILYFIAVILSAYCVIFLFSRGAYLGCLIGIAFITLFKKKILLIPLIILLLAWQALLPRVVVERITMTKSEDGRLEHSADARVEMWKQSLKYFERNQIMGIGYGTIRNLGLILGDTHNLYVKILVEQGIIGFILFLIFIARGFLISWKLSLIGQTPWLKGLGFAFSACIVTVLITNIFGDRWSYTQIGTYFWVLLGLVVRNYILAVNKCNIE
ncbi:MAG TPA: O-antigen ligase family protein [Candidatus Omnitrophota bacterium]|nr:O-antigen ligase family protein [Candidatus Omnitrophota bacterium]